MKVKFFSALHHPGSIWAKRDPAAAIEQAVNAWLADNPAVRIVSTHQSVAGGAWSPTTYFVSVWYEPAPEPSHGSSPGGS